MRPNVNIDSIMLVHGLRPNTMVGHKALYKNVLHHCNYTISKWFLETVDIYASILNDCSYCIDHHFNGLKRILNEDIKAELIKKKLITNSFETFFDKDYSLVLRYAEKLTKNPSQITKDQIVELINTGVGND